MNASCANHPDHPAVGECGECGAAICSECSVAVGEKTACRKCVEEIRARVAAEMAAPTAVGAEPVTAPARFDLSGEPVGSETGSAAVSPAVLEPMILDAPAPYTPLPSTVQAPPIRPRLLVGAIFGIVVGMVGAVIWEKVAFHMHMEIGYINIAVGFAIGWAVVTGSGATGKLAAFLGALIAFSAMMFGYYLLANDELGKLFTERAGAGVIQVPWLSLDLFLEFLKELSPIDWVFVAIGVYGGYRMPMSASSAHEA